MAVTLLVVALLLSGTGLPRGDAQVLTPRAYMPLALLLQPPQPVGYGVQAHAWDAPEYVIDLAENLGVGWIKQQVRWEYVESSPDSYRWGEADRIVDAAEQAGLRVLFSVVAAPDWSRPGQSGNGPPDNDQDFADFMGVVAARYEGRVHAYEIWNEQNLRREWDGEGVQLDAADYVQLLAAVYGAVKAADPWAVVVSGGLAPVGFTDLDIAIDDRVYVQQMYDAGLAGVCDAVGAHPYGFGNPPDTCYTGGDPDPTRGWDDHPSFYFCNTFQDYYAIMVANGDHRKRVWATEFGWPTVDGMGVPPNDGYGYAAYITEQQQADYITGAYAWAAQWDHAGVLFLWNLNMWPIVWNGAENEMSKFSILRGDWSPRPAYTALQAMPK